MTSEAIQGADTRGVCEGKAGRAGLCMRIQTPTPGAARVPRLTSSIMSLRWSKLYSILLTGCAPGSRAGLERWAK